MPRSPGSGNPFQPPRSKLGTEFGAAETDLDAEATRRAHLAYEVLIESLGTLGLILAIVAAILTVVMGLVSMGPETPSIRRGFGVGALISLGFTALSGGIGYGLGRFQPWARTASTGIICLLTLAVLARIGLLVSRGSRIIDEPARMIPLAILVLGTWCLAFLLYSRGGRLVFSPAYHGVKSRTAHIDGRVSPVLLLAAVLILLLIAAGAIIPLVNPGR